MSDDWRRSPSKRFQVAAIAAVGYPLINLLGHTLRWRVEGLHHFESAVATGRPPVMTFWHGRILPATFYFRRRGIVVMTSENFDGEWIARIIERFGYPTAFVAAAACVVGGMGLLWLAPPLSATMRVASVPPASREEVPCCDVSRSSSSY